jgi:VanZ family protein
MKSVKHLLRYWLPPLAWMGLIFFVSSQPDVPSPPGPLLQELYEKGGHALAYAVLAWFYLRALRHSIRAASTARLIGGGLAALHALSDEYHQTFVPGRSGDLLDVLVDGVGICGAILLDWWLERRRRLRLAASQAAESHRTEGHPTPAQ